MGILDYQPDPIGQGLLGFGTALMQPRAMGGGMAAGLNAFNAQALQAKQLQRQAQQDALREQLLQAQMQNYQSAAEERKAQAEAQRAKMEQAQRQADEKRGLLGSLAAPPMGFRDANIAMGGTAPAGYVPPPQGGQPITQDFAVKWLAAGGSLDELKQLAESRNFGRSKVAREVSVAGPDGMPRKVLLDDFGQQIGDGFDEPVKKELVNRGDKFEPINPYTVSGPLSINMSAAEQASNAVARGNLGVAQANLGLSRERLDMERRQAAGDGPLGKPPAGYRWKPDSPGALEPIPGGPADPSVDRNKPPTESQSKDFLFASRAAAADKIVRGLKDPSIYGAALNANLDGVPLVGGAMAGGQNALLSSETQKFMQAKRDFINAVLRKESGAVIGKDEFRSADLQYFPQPGDNDAVKAQKAESRRLAVEGIAAGAGSLSKGLSKPAGGATGGWSIVREK